MHTEAGDITQFTMPYSCLILAGSWLFFLQFSRVSAGLWLVLTLKKMGDKTHSGPAEHSHGASLRVDKIPFRQTTTPIFSYHFSFLGGRHACLKRSQSNRGAKCIMLEWTDAPDEGKKWVWGYWRCRPREGRSILPGTAQRRRRRVTTGSWSSTVAVIPCYK